MRSDRERLVVAIAAMAEVFNRGLSDVSIELYANGLAAWPIEAVEASMVEVVRSSRFFPSVYEWGEHAAEWWRERQSALREERIRARALAEHGTMSESQRAEAEANAAALRKELAEKLGWNRPKAQEAKP